MNRFTFAEQSILLREKLGKLAQTLNSDTASFVTREAVLGEVVRLLNTFYRNLNEPLFSHREINVGNIPNLVAWNQAFELILGDLSSVFSELENLEVISVANFNFLVTEVNRLSGRTKSIASKLGDYALYSTSLYRDALFVTDSFSNLNRIDVGSPLLNRGECSVNQDEGIVLLPEDKTRTVLVSVKDKPVINTNSNGMTGNNHQTEASYHGDINTILDNNADTWFEYERVVGLSDSQSEKLILDITINLGDPAIINHIRVNPNNFGTKSGVYIDTIETSLDGRYFLNIKDDVPLAGFTTIDEENVFLLSPSVSKFAGQGIYTFTPRKAKYVHLVFSQTEPYNIETPSGTRLRYAIGIRDVDIFGLVFNNVGELVSDAFEFQDEVKKVLLDTNQNPSSKSELAGIEYFVSGDNGQSWYPIQPKGFTGPAGEVSLVPEILNFNTIDSNSVNTPVPVKSLRLKTRFFRNDDSFDEEVASLAQSILTRSELHIVPETSPFVFELERSPVQGRIKVIDPLFGSRGIESAQYIIDKGFTQTVSLPFDTLPRPVEKTLLAGNIYHTRYQRASDWIHVTVQGEEWTHATQSLSGYTANGSNQPQYRLYVLDIPNKTIRFGNGYDTMSPPENAPIGVYFEPETLFPSSVQHLAKLDFATSHAKKEVSIEIVYPTEWISEVLPRGASVVRLKYGNLVDISSIENVFGLGNKVNYVNGRDEISTSTNWSIDTDEGILYLGSAVDTAVDTTVKYSYRKIEALSENDWDWSEENYKQSSVTINDSGWKTFEQDFVQLFYASNSKLIELPHLNIVDGTLELELTDASPISDSSYPLWKEVKYVDGNVELGAIVTRTTENVPPLIPSGGVANFELKENISSESRTNHDIVFSNTSLFVTEKSTLSLTSEGDYYVDIDPASPTYRTVYVKTASSVNAGGSVEYYFYRSNHRDAGLYSVDYNMGKIYTQRPFDTTWTLKAKYQYTNYRAKYKIARELSPDVYSIDVVNNRVAIQDEEVLRRRLIRGLSTSYYQVVYDYVDVVRDDLSLLRDYFTPILKDYSLKIVTKGQLDL